MTYDELHYRTYAVYRNLGHWISQRTEDTIAASYADLAIRRFAEGVPLEEIVFALIATKNHLYSYVRTTGLVDSAVELHQERELRRLIGHFFDNAIFYTVRAYEREASLFHAKRSMKSAA